LEKSFGEHKKSEDFAKKSAQGKKNVSNKGPHNHRLGRDSYTIAILKWRKMEKDLLAKGIIPAVYN
jgi:hypothetical protein